MGVEGLSKLVKAVREVKLQEFKGSTFAIDALVELNRVYKGQVVLTNKSNLPHQTVKIFLPQMKE